MGYLNLKRSTDVSPTTAHSSRNKTMAYGYRTLRYLLIFLCVLSVAVGQERSVLSRSASEATVLSSFTWSAFGLGVNADIWAMAVSGTDVYVGGLFSTAGGNSTGNVAKWDGSAWSSLGTGIPNFYVEGMAASGTDIYMGGLFSSAGGVTVSNIAKWDGSSFSALGSGINSEVASIAVGNGYVYAAGAFSQAGGITASNIARWNGASWSAVGSGLNAFVYALASSGTDLYAGGQFTMSGSAPIMRIAKWDGSAWSALGSGMNNNVLALAVNGNELYAGGQFTTAGGGTANYIARWDGSSWSALGGGVNGYVRAIAVSGTDVYVGGDFTEATQSDGITTISAIKIAKWSGGVWTAVGGGAAGSVRALAVSAATSSMVVGGSFATVDGSIAASKVASFTDAENSLAVTLVEFVAAEEPDGGVILCWLTGSETDNAGWDVERRVISNVEARSKHFEAIGFVAGSGTRTTSREYSYIDLPAPGRYAYRLKQLDRSGTYSYSNEVEVEVGSVPREFALQQNYPNPFNPSTTIRFTLAQDGLTALCVYDLLGREVARLVDAELKAGELHQVEFDASEYPSGLYLVRLSSGSLQSVRKILLAK